MQLNCSEGDVVHGRRYPRSCRFDTEWCSRGHVYPCTAAAEREAVSSLGLRGGKPGTFAANKVLIRYERLQIMLKELMKEDDG